MSNSKELRVYATTSSDNSVNQAADERTWQQLVEEIQAVVIRYSGWESILAHMEDQHL